MAIVIILMKLITWVKSAIMTISTKVTLIIKMISLILIMI